MKIGCNESIRATCSSGSLVTISTSSARLGLSVVRLCGSYPTEISSPPGDGFDYLTSIVLSNTDSVSQTVSLSKNGRVFYSVVLPAGDSISYDGSTWGKTINPKSIDMEAELKELERRLAQDLLKDVGNG